ncbi:MAG: sugar phosphate nucleotidyltransferase, partial [Oscillospiraceae bacterium]
MQNEQCCAIILAAGDGKRMKASCPKAMCNVLFKPMISWVADSCIAFGAEKACVITGDGGEQIEKILPKNFITVKQYERKGTGHAVMMAKEFIRDNKQNDFIVLCADAPFVDSEIIKESYELHKSSNSTVTLITAELENPFGYGRIVRDGDEVKAIAEQKDANPEQLQIKEINSGSYWFKGEFLLEALELLTCNNAGGEYYLTDAVFHAVNKGKKVTAYKCRDNKA